MASRARKLLPLPVPEHDPTLTIPGSPVSSHSDYYVSSSYGGGFSSYRLNPPLDASMALTILVLLIALFLMGFFSVYIRRFSEDSSSLQRASHGSSKGADPDALDSLPVYIYNGAAKQETDCTICLSELEEGQRVKTIPYCGHVFHVQCIDTWLGRHVTCPLCRTARLFPPPEEVSAVDPRDTWSEEDQCAGPGGLRRSSSCLLVSPHRLVCFRRSLSF